MGGDLRRHLKTHSGEKSNKCNTCDNASSQAGDLRRHLKTHSGEKSNKCNTCDFASSYVSAFRTHLECIVAKSQTRPRNPCHVGPLKSWTFISEQSISLL